MSTSGMIGGWLIGLVGQILLGSHDEYQPIEMVKTFFKLKVMNKLQIQEKYYWNISIKVNFWLFKSINGNVIYIHYKVWCKHLTYNFNKNSLCNYNCYLSPTDILFWVPCIQTGTETRLVDLVRRRVDSHSTWFLVSSPCLNLNSRHASRLNFSSHFIPACFTLTCWTSLVSSKTARPSSALQRIWEQGNLRLK